MNKRNSQTGIFNRRLLLNAEFSTSDISIPEKIVSIISSLPEKQQLEIYAYVREVHKKSFELPVIKPVNEIPNKIIPFSEAMNKNNRDFDCWVCFYEDDSKFEVIRNDPMRHISHLQKFRGIISPDFSIQSGSARSTQLLNTYCGRVFASYLQRMGILVIPNIRYAGKVSRDFCCEGISSNSVVAVGALGCLNRHHYIERREIFFEGLDFIVELLTPKAVIVYGSSSISDFRKYVNQGVDIRLYPPFTRLVKEKFSKFRCV